MIKLLTFVKTYWFAFTLFIIVVISILSLWPLENLPSVPGSDKTHHIIAYAILMFPVALRKTNYCKLTVIFFIAYGGVIELLQPYVNRHGDWLDMVANIVGLVCGLLVVELIFYFFPKRI
jgi:hypothetical protein